MPHHFRSQPVRRVILAEAVAFVAVDQAFVEDLEDIAFYLLETEAADMRHDPADQFFALRIGDHPIKEVAFDRAVDAGVGKGLPRKHPLRVVLVKDHDRKGDAFGDDHEVGVLEPQGVALYFSAVDELKRSAQSWRFRACAGSSFSRSQAARSSRSTRW